MADEPETQEQYESRRKTLIAERLAKELISKVRGPPPKLEGENDYAHMQVDTYARPKA